MPVPIVLGRSESLNNTDKPLCRGHAFTMHICRRGQGLEAVALALVVLSLFSVPALQLFLLAKIIFSISSFRLISFTGP